jgi:predicted DNA-binding transcriptional regulator YafY
LKNLKTYSEFAAIQESLLENVLNTQTMEKLEDLINNKLACTVDYRGENARDVLNGIRVIEPYAVGVSENGETYLRAWLIRGISKSGRVNPRLVPGWRLFKVDRIRSVSPTLQKFTIPRKGYKAEDSSMSEVLFSATF